MWFKVNGLRTNDGIEEILSNADKSNMVYYNSHQDSINVLIVEHGPLMAKLHVEIDAIDRQQDMTNAIEGDKNENLEESDMNARVEDNRTWHILVVL